VRNIQGSRRSKVVLQPLAKAGALHVTLGQPLLASIVHGHCCACTVVLVCLCANTF